MTASPGQIVFNGIGENNYNSLTARIKSLDIDMRCKPNLIVRTLNTNILYEFKAVSELRYLFNTEFDSNHAQVWCYSALQEIQIDEYFLVRYYVDPFKYPFTQMKQLTPLELNQSKFEKFLNFIIKQYKN